MIRLENFVYILVRPSFYDQSRQFQNFIFIELASVDFFEESRDQPSVFFHSNYFSCQSSRRMNDVSFIGHANFFPPLDPNPGTSPTRSHSLPLEPSNDHFDQLS